MAPRQTKRRRLLAEADEEVGSAEGDWIEINVSSTQWENAIDSVLKNNDVACTPTEGDAWNSNLDQDNPIRAHICDLTGILDPDLLWQSTDERLRQSKFGMAAGSTVASVLEQN